MKKSILTSFLSLFVIFLMAQSQPLLRPVHEYSFAHFERNRILYPGEKSSMERFYQKLDSVVFQGEGHVSIMHIGGSHVQAGVFTQRFRDNLLSISPEMIGGQFFVFPFGTGGTNNPSYFKVSTEGEWSYCRNAVVHDTDKRMGLAGAAVTTTSDEASISIMTHAKSPTVNTPEFYFDKVKILGYSDDGDVVPVIDSENELLEGKYDKKNGLWSFTLPALTDSICIRFDNMPGEFTITGILLENGMPGISVQGVGVNGASVPSYLRCEDFERDLELIKPDLIIFGIGINDASEKDFTKQGFMQNYRQLIAVMRRVNPDCALLFMTNNDSYKRIKKNHYEVNLNGRVVEQAFLELAVLYGAGVWDQFDIMGGLGSMRDWEDVGLAKKDKVHFTNEGYQLMGDLLYNAFISDYMDYLRRNSKRH